MESHTTPELVFIPAPGMGHIPSTVELAKLLLTRNDLISVSIHIIELPNHASKIQAYVDTQSRLNPYPDRLTFVTYPPQYDPTDPCTSLESIFSLIRAHQPLVKQAVEARVRDGLGNPVGFVLDMFCSGMADIARNLNVPSYVFSTSGAGGLMFILYAQWLADHQGVDVAAVFSDPGYSGVVPGFENPVPTAVVPYGFKDKEYMCEVLLNLGRRFREMKGILVNTYVELEPLVMHALWEDHGSQGIPRVFPVGPTLVLGDKGRGGPDSGEEKNEVIQWLDGQPESSVVFLCFGSCGCFDEEQVKEIANGLDRSGYRFLWALRLFPREGAQRTTLNEKESFLEVLPEGFIERTAHKGKVIGWVPQVEVLAHPATGGFVSHCGWNSTLESMWFGVPMATWPLGAEQQLTAFQLVKEARLAVEIRMDYNVDWPAGKGNFIVTTEEIEKGVKKLMSMDKKMKENVKKMSEEGRKAQEEGGSSYSWLGHFIEDVVSNANLKSA
ncbi:hypothetical protein vseg_019601 [Gypsophila vaccaria]